jgi:hypothetical protein
MSPGGSPAVMTPSANGLRVARVVGRGPVTYAGSGGRIDGPMAEQPTSRRHSANGGWNNHGPATRRDATD